jgi:hypothetical protein
MRKETNNNDNSQNVEIDNDIIDINTLNYTASFILSGDKAQELKVLIEGLKAKFNSKSNRDEI